MEGVVLPYVDGASMGASKLRVWASSGVGGFGQGIRVINDGVSLCGMRQDGRR